MEPIEIEGEATVQVPFGGLVVGDYFMSNSWGARVWMKIPTVILGDGNIRNCVVVCAGVVSHRLGTLEHLPDTYYIIPLVLVQPMRLKRRENP